MGLLDFLFGKKNQNSSCRQQATNERSKHTQPPSSSKVSIESSDSILELLNNVIGTEEKPVQVEKQKLQDGSIYTGQAILLQNGFYLPCGYGKIKYMTKI